MRGHYRNTFVVPLLFSLVVVPRLVTAQDAKHEEHQGPGTGQTGIPESMRIEHREIHDALVRATQVRSPVGAAARDLARILDPHFAREEQIALPPLGLLVALSRGEPISSAAVVLAMTDTLRRELPGMLDQHKAIRAATLRLRDIARRAGNAEVELFTHKLALHAQNEEEVTYPAAVLVGEVIRAQRR